MPAMRGGVRAASQKKVRRRHFHPLGGQKQQRCAGQEDGAGVSHRLAEGAIQRIVIHRGLAVPQILGDGRAGEADVMEMGLRDIGLYGESKHNQGGNQAPTAHSPFVCRSRHIAAIGTHTANL